MKRIKVSVNSIVKVSVNSIVIFGGEVGVGDVSEVASEMMLRDDANFLEAKAGE